MTIDEPRNVPLGIRYGPHLAILSVGYVVFAYASVPSVVMDRFGVRFTEVGLLMSAALAAFVVVQAVGGRLIGDRSTVDVLLALVGTHAVLAAGLDFLESFYPLVAGRALWGLVGGLALTVGATQIARANVPGAVTRHQGVYGAMLTLGGALGFLLAPRIVAVTGWYGVHALGGLLALPAVVALWRVRDVTVLPPAANRGVNSGRPRDQGADSTRSGDLARTTDSAPNAGGSEVTPERGGHGSDRDGPRSKRAARSVPTDPDQGEAPEIGPPGDGVQDDRWGTLSDPVVLLAAICYVATLGAYVTLSTFVTAYFEELGIVGPLNALALFVASLGRASGGLFGSSSRVDDGRLIALTAGVGAVGLTGLAAGSGAVLVVLPLVVLVAVCVPFGAIFKIAAVATRRDAAALALVVAAGNVAALLLPAITGAVRDATGGYEAAFLLMATLNGLAALAGVAITRRT